MSDSPEQGWRFWRVLEYVIFVVAALFAISEAADGVKGDHAVSRLASVYSLTHYGSWYIDNPDGTTPNPFEPETIDKVMVRGNIGDGVIRNGRIISSKPPILPLLMTGEYLALRAVAGWDLDDQSDLPHIVFVMTLTFVGGGYLLALMFFRCTLLLAGIQPWVRVYLLVALAFGTQLWGFSGKLSNHVTAAGLLAVAIYFAVGLGSGALVPKPWRFLAYGFAGALTVTIDLPMAAFVGLAGIPLLIRFPVKTAIWVGIGAGVPLAVHFGIMVAVTGSPLPVQVRKETYFFENAYWRHPMGIDALTEPKSIYLFHILFGRTGIFLLYPVLLTGLGGVLSALRSPKASTSKAILLGAAAFPFLVYYYVTGTNNYGGESYGFRWFIGAMPMLLLMGAPWLNGLRRKAAWVVLGVLLVVSLYSGWECAQVDWESGREWTSRIFGPAYVQIPSN